MKRLFTRRTLLKAGLGVGGGALLLGGGALALFRTGPAAPGKRVLSLDEVAFVGALAEVYLPPSNALGLDARALDPAAGLDDHLASVGARERRLFRSLLALFDQWPRVSFASAGRFSALSLDERTALMRAWEESESPARRGVASLLRIVLAMHLFASPAALAALGHRFGCGPLP